MPPKLRHDVVVAPSRFAPTDANSTVLLELACVTGKAEWAPAIVSTKVDQNKTTFKDVRDFLLPRFGLDEERWTTVEESFEEVSRQKSTVKCKATRFLRGLLLRVYCVHREYGGRHPERRLLESEEDFVEVLTAHPITVDATVNCAIRDLVLQSADPRDPDDFENALHSLWELASNQEQHGSFTLEAVQAVYKALSLDDFPARTVLVAASAAWALSVSTRTRSMLIELGAVELLINVVKTLNAAGGTAERAGSQTRILLREACVGSLSMMIIDPKGRHRLFRTEPNGASLLKLANFKDLAPRAGSTTPLLDTASRSNSRAGVSRQASLAKDSAEPAASNDFPATSPGPKDSRMADMAEDAGGGVGEEADGAAVGWGGCQCQLHAARAVCSALVRDASLRAPFCKAGGLNLLDPLLSSDNLEMAFVVTATYATFGYNGGSAAAISEAGTSLRTFGILVDLLHGLLQMIEHEADHHQDQVPRILLELSEACSVAVWTLCNAVLHAHQIISAEALAVLVDCIEMAMQSPARKLVLFNLIGGLSSVCSSFEMASLLMGFTPLKSRLTTPAASPFGKLTAFSRRAIPHAAEIIHKNPIQRYRVARLLTTLMQLPAESADAGIVEPSPHDVHGVFVRSAAAVAATYISQHTWVQTGYKQQGDNRIDLLSIGHGAILKTSIESAMAGSADGFAHMLAQESACALLMWLSSAAWSVERNKPDEHTMSRYLSLLEMAAHPGAAVLLLVGLWYLIRDPEVRNMVTFATIEEEVEESGAAAEPEAEASTEEHANDSSQAHADKGEEQNASVSSTADELKTDPNPEESENDQSDASSKQGVVAPKAPEPPKGGRCLHILLGLANKWLPDLTAAETPDAPVVKMFEFWIGALWLTLYRPEDKPTKRPEVFANTKRTYWTVTPLFADALRHRPRQTQSLLVLLQQLMEMHDAQHANVRELALGLTWNISVRDIGLESQLTMMGVSNTLIRCVTDKLASVAVRRMAMGFLHHLLSLPEHRVRLERLRTTPKLHEALVDLVQARNWQLAQVASHGLAHRTFQPGESSSLHSLGAVPKLVKLLEDLETVRGMANTELPRLYSLIALLNMSTKHKLQTSIAKHSVHVVLQICTLEPPGSEPRQVAEALLRNMSRHPKNRTCLYKCELAYKTVKVREEHDLQRAETSPTTSPARTRPAVQLDQSPYRQLDQDGERGALSTPPDTPTSNLEKHPEDIADLANPGNEEEGARPSVKSLFQPVLQADNQNVAVYPSFRSLPAEQREALGMPYKPPNVVAKFASWAEESFGEAAMDVDGKRTKSAPTGPLDPYKVRNQKIAAAKEKKLAKRKAKKEKQQKQKVDATRANDGLGPSRLSTPATSVPGMDSSMQGSSAEAHAEMPLLRLKLNRPLAQTWERLGTPPERPITAGQACRPISTPSTSEPRPSTAVSGFNRRVHRSGVPSSKLPNTETSPPSNCAWTKPEKELPPEIPSSGGDGDVGSSLEGKRVPRTFARGVRAILDLSNLAKAMSATPAAMAARPSSPTKTSMAFPDSVTKKDMWKPPVAKFVEADSATPLTRVAARLLKVKCPNTVSTTLTSAAKDLADAMTQDQLWTDGQLRRAPRPDLAANKNPPPDRPLTVLQVAPQEAHPAFPAQDNARCLSPRLQPAGNGSGLMDLNVQIGSEAKRNTLKFGLRPAESVAKQPARTVVFEHVDGCQVCMGLYSHFRMPNGRLGHFFDKGSGMHDEMDVPPINPPSQPMALGDLLQTGLPLPEVLTMMVAPDTCYPQLLFRPVPPTPALPEKHILPVSDPQDFSRKSFNQLKTIPLRLTLEAGKQDKITEEIVFRSSEEFALKRTVFAPRAKEADSREFQDGAAVVKTAVDELWKTVSKKDRVLFSVKQVLKKFPQGLTLSNALSKMMDTIVKYFVLIDGVYAYICVMGEGAIAAEEYENLLSKCDIMDEGSEKVTYEQCMEIFNSTMLWKKDKKGERGDSKAADGGVDKAAEKQTKKKKGKKRKEKDSDMRALSRTSFLEVLLQLAIAKYNNNDRFKKIRCQDPVSAVEQLMEQNLKMYLPVALAQARDPFRETRLYTKEMANLLKTHQRRLFVIFRLYTRPKAGQDRLPYMLCDEWVRMLRDMHLLVPKERQPKFLEGVTEEEAKLCFVQSRMLVIDADDRLRVNGITFVDFLEALGRLSDISSIVTEDELRELRYANVMVYMLECENNASKQHIEGPSGRPHPTRRRSAHINTPKTRPLHEKMKMMLDATFRFAWVHLEPGKLSFTDSRLSSKLEKLNKEMEAEDADQMSTQTRILGALLGRHLEGDANGANQAP